MQAQTSTPISLSTMSPPPSSAVAGTSPPLRSPGTRGRTSFHLPRHPRRRSSTMTTGTNFSSAFDGEGEGGSGSPGGSVYEEEWEGGDEGDEYVKRYGRGRRGKKDEPMSPLAVVCEFELSFDAVRMLRGGRSRGYWPGVAGTPTLWMMRKSRRLLESRTSARTGHIRLRPGHALATGRQSEGPLDVS